MKTLDPTKPYCGMGNIENMMAVLYAEVEACVEIPNSWLPTEFHDNVRGCRTLKRLNQLCAKRDGEESAHKILKATKARNVERMAAQVASLESTGEMDFDLDYSQNEKDDMAKYRAECALISGMISGGLIDADELLED